MSNCREEGRPLLDLYFEDFGETAGENVQSSSSALTRSIRIAPLKTIEDERETRLHHLLLL